jgi:hypothetical protein
MILKNSGGEFGTENNNVNCMRSQRTKVMKRSNQIFIFLLIGFVLISGCSSVQQKNAPSKVIAPATTPALNQTPAPVLSAKTPTPASTIIAVSTTENPGFRTKGSLDKMYPYVVDGTPGFIPLKVYTGVDDYIGTLGDIYTNDDYNQIVDNDVQREYISPMVKNIRLNAKNPDDEARIAISLVQHIKYDANTINEIQVNTSKTGQSYIGRYPYTILYQNWGGICGEKSFLLALLLKDLGYSVALFEFDGVHHMAVGIKAPPQYSYKNTGYALIESTAPQIPTFDDYFLAGMKSPMSSISPTKIIKVSDGKAFDSINREYSDAQIEHSIYQAAYEVEAAGEILKACEQKLNELGSTVEYWKNQVQSAPPNSPTYDYDLRMYNDAYSAYSSYYSETYYPSYTKWDSLNKKFQEIYVPKQKPLDEKYGLNAGFNVGL